MTPIALAALAAVAALQGPAPPAPTPAPAARELHFCTQHGPLFVRLQRGQGAGVYSILDNGDIGAFVGRLDGRTLEGRWYETDTRGDVRIVFNDTWDAIELRYRSDGDPRWRGDWDGVPTAADGTRTVKKNGTDYRCGDLTAAGAAR